MHQPYIAVKDRIMPDWSPYVDAPLGVQLINIYLNRAAGFYLQSKVETMREDSVLHMLFQPNW